jgi:nitroreductase
MDVQHAILTRRSIRKYRADAVPETVLQNILAAGRQGPSWANTQTPRFVVVSDSGLKQQLAATLSTNNPAGAAMQQAPLVIVGCALRGLAGFKQGEASTDKGDWFMFDAGIAMQNMVLSAHAEGLGTVYVGAFDAAGAEKILGVPDGVSAVAMLVLGYPDQEPAERPRLDISEIVFYERYGQQK